MIKQALIFSILLLVGTAQLFAETESFTRFNTKNKNEYVYDMTQDSLGYIWLATGKGLKRMDEKNIINYSKDLSTISSQVIQTVNIMNQKIWFTNKDGQIFVQNGYQTSQIKSPFKNSIIASFQIDNEIIMFISKNEGILLYNSKLKTGTLKNINSSNINTASKIGSKLYLGSPEGIESITIKNKDLDIGQTFFKDFNVTCITTLTDSTILLGTNRKGIFVTSLDLKQTPKPFKTHLFDLTKTIKNITLDTHKNIWVATFGAGVLEYRYDEELNDYVSVIQEAQNPKYKFINKAYLDKEQNIWLATYGKGLLFKPNDFINQLKSDASLLSLPVTALKKHGDFLYYANGKSIISIDNFNNMDTLFSLDIEDRIKSINFYDSTTLLVGCYQTGLYKVDLSNNFKSTSLNFIGSITTKKINDLLVIGDSIWIATYDGLFCLDIDGNILEKYSTENGLRHNLINSIKKQSDGTIVVGSKSNRVFYIKNKAVNEIKLPSDFQNINIIEVEISENDDIYIGTMGSGLFIIRKNQISHITTDNGLPSNYVYGIKFINPNQVFIYTESKSVIYHTNEKTIKSIETKFNQHSEFIARANESFNDDKIYIGTNEGMLIFDSEKYLNTSFIPYLGFTKLIINDSIYNIGEIDKEINLKHDIYKVEIDFRSVNFAMNENIKYYYRLHGFDNDWHETSNAFAVYKQLESGEYQFEIKVCNFDNCSNKRTSFKIKIQQPFWKSYWFILGALIIFFWFIILSFIFQSRSNRKNKKLLEYSIQLKNQELKLTNNDLTKSIEYTKLIQTTVLPVLSDMENNVLDIFMIQESRHYVSGDFIWFRKTESHLTFALADPQEVGVPGGLLSIWCINILNNTVIDHDINNPKIILDYLHKHICKELNNTDKSHSIKMIVGSLELDKQILTISSANQDALFISQSGEVEKLDKTSKSLGDETANVKFQNTSFDLTKYSSFYLYSDGVKQLHKEATKGKLKPLSTHFLKYAKDETYEQKQIFGYKLDEWSKKIMGGAKDDLTLLGFRIKR